MQTALPEQPQHTAANLSDIIYRAPGDLQPWPSNPRTHPAKQLFRLKKSIETFGFTAPVLVDEASVILSGHGRVLAALELGLASIPTRVIYGLTPAKKRAYVIADNKLAQLSEWDGGLLKAEMALLIQADFDIELTAFSTADIDIMFDDAANAAGSDPDDLQPADIAPDVVSRPGDLFRLGNHLLLCGDALEASCVFQ